MGAYLWAADSAGGLRALFATTRGAVRVAATSMSLTVGHLAALLTRGGGE